MTESLGWTETFPLLYLWSCLQRRLRQATSYSKLLQITWSDLMLDWCLRQSTSHRVSVVYHSYGGMVDMTKASDKSGVNKLFWNVMVGITRSKVICFFVCCPKVLPHFPIPTTVLTAKETAYLALVDVQTLPIKTVKIHHRKHLLAESDCLRACIFLDQHVIWDENEATSKSRQLANVC